MAKKKSKRTRRSGSGRRKNQFRRNLLKAFVGLAVLVVLIVAAGAVLNYLLMRKTAAPPMKSVPKVHRRTLPGKKGRGKKAARRAGAAKHAQPIYEIYPHKELPPPPPLTPLKPLPAEKPPWVAIIIDDVGYDRAMAEKFIGLKEPLTLSIFPFAPHCREIAATAYRKGLGVMLHLPMEPDEYPDVDPGPGKLLTGMTPDQLIAQLRQDLGSVPYIRGVNNHMGSKLTTYADQMNQIFTILKKRGLFFIDSRTTAKTVCRSAARLLQVPFAQRNVFLDNRQNAASIRSQLKKLVRYARRHGQAVGIGHPHGVTYRVLKAQLPKIAKQVHLVTAAQIVHVIS